MFWAQEILEEMQWEEKIDYSEFLTFLLKWAIKRGLIFIKITWMSKQCMLKLIPPKPLSIIIFIGHIM